MAKIFSRGPKGKVLVRNQIMAGRTVKDIIPVLREQGYPDKAIRKTILAGVKLHHKEQTRGSKEDLEERLSEALATLQERGY